MAPVATVCSFCGALVLTVLGILSPARAESPAAILPGWFTVGGSGAPSAGIALSGKPIRFSSPVVAEIDGDPANGLETAVGGGDGRVYVYRANGSLLWERDVPPLGCPRKTAPSRLFSAPAVGALHGDGVPFVVIGYGGFVSGDCDGGVVAFRGPDGAQEFTFSTLKFAKKMKFGERLHAVYSSPALADTDGDGRLEIAFGSFDRRVYLLEHDGTVRWYYVAADTVFSSPTFADVNGDGKLEVIIGTDISANGRLRPPTQNGGFVYALKSDKRKEKRIGFRDRSAYVWQTFLPQVVFSSPVVADVMRSNPGPEIVVGSGCFFPQGSAAKKGRQVSVLRLRDGKLIKKLRTSACFPSSAGIGDLNGDGVNDVVVFVQGSRTLGGPGQSRLTAFNVEAGVALWSVVPKVLGKNDAASDFNSPVTADLDGNGSLEVIVANQSGLAIYNGIDGRPLSCEAQECFAPAVSLLTRDGLRATPAVADLDLDGALDVVIGGAAGGRGRLYGWTGFAGIGSSAGTYPPFSAPWPMWRGAPSHSTVVP